MSRERHRQRRRSTSALTCLAGMPKKLVIVESPAKAKTIAGYLGPEYVVESSIGHIRDLPKRASDVPKEERKRFGALGVDLEDEFKPYYIVDPDKKKVIAGLKSKLKDADELLLATDEDREGEAIAWHIPGAPAEGPDAAHGLPRDHEGRDRGRARAHPRRSTSARRLAGDAADPRPALRLRGLARALEEGDAAAVGRPRPVGGDAARRRARARTDGVRVRRVLGHRGRFRSRALRGAARSTRREADRAGPRLRPRRAARPEGRPAARRGRCALARRRARGRRLRRPLRRGEAVHPPPGCALHDLDPPAGGVAQAALHGPDDDARRPAAVRARLHHLHAHRLDDAVRDGADGGADAGARAVRPGVRPRCAAALRPQGQERAGGARGDPSCGRAVPPPRRRARRARPRRAGALRARLDAHRRVADGGRPRADRLAPGRRGRGDRRGRRVRCQRHRDHLPRLSSRVRGRPRRGHGRGRGAAVAAPEGRRRGAARLARAAGPRDLAAGPLHGADARQGAGGLRHRPPLDVRVDPRDDPRPWVCREARPGARADVPGFRRDEAARAALRQARRLRLHGADGGRSRPHCRRRGAEGRLADDGSTGARTASPACTPWSRSTSTRSMPAR